MSASSTLSVGGRIFSAIRKGKVRRLIQYIEMQESLEIKDVDGRTPIVYTVCAGKEDSRTHIVRMLIRQECDVNSRDCYGQTALMYACMDTNRLDMVRLLSRTKRCNPNIQDLAGFTAMMHAVSSNNIGAIRVLVNTSHTKSVADLTLKNSHGLTALDLSIKLKLFECCQILVLEGGCDTSQIKERRILLLLLGKKSQYSSRARTPYNSRTSRTLPLSPLDVQAEDKRESLYSERNTENVSRLSLRQPTFKQIVAVDIGSSCRSLKKTPEPLYHNNTMHILNSNMITVEPRMPSNLKTVKPPVRPEQQSPKAPKRALTPISIDNSRTLSISPQSQLISQRSKLPSIPSGKKLFLVGSQKGRQTSDL